jgi:hypothetical protein
MRRNGMLNRMAVVTLSCLMAMSCLSVRAAAPQALCAGVGQSVRETPDQAGEEAARGALASLKASKGYAGAEPSLVLVMASASVFKPELVDGVARVFPDKTRIYGACCWRPIGNEDLFSNQELDKDKGHAEIKAGVSVLALAGPITVTAASADAGALQACGRDIGKALAPGLKDPAPGTLLLTFGRQPYRQNPPYLEGLFQGLGSKVPVLGISVRNDLVIYQGRICSKINLGLLLRGAFAVSSDIQQGVDLAAAVKATDAVFKAGVEPFAVVLVANCTGRAGSLIKSGKLSKDWETLREKAPGTPLFGGYGGGEIGTRADGQVVADGHCIGIAALKELSK